MAVEGAVPPPYHEPLRATLIRTIAIAAGVAAGLAFVVQRSGSWGLSWLVLFPSILWFSLGGHYVELLYLNGVLPRSRVARRFPRAARVGVWMAGGVVLGAGMLATYRALGGNPGGAMPWWWGAVGFVAVECVVHAVLAAARLPSFWNGRG